MQQVWKSALDSASDSLLRFLRELEPIGPGPTSDSASGDAFRLVDDMVRLLCRISLSKPLIVLMDDLHRMDPSSLRLIEYALRLEAPARLLIVGTFRPGEATAAAFRTVLSQAASASSSIPFELPPLKEFEVAQLIEFESGQPPGAAYRQHVFERSEGNPFCVVELVRQTKQLADSGLGSAATSVPAGVWSMIATRLGRLPAECLNRLQAASVLGREFELHELAVMLDADYRAVLGSLQPALDARILESASGDKQLAFAHILIRDGLYAELPLVRRNELHLAA